MNSCEDCGHSKSGHMYGSGCIRSVPNKDGSHIHSPFSRVCPCNRSYDYHERVNVKPSSREGIVYSKDW